MRKTFHLGLVCALLLALPAAAQDQLKAPAPAAPPAAQPSAAPFAAQPIEVGRQANHNNGTVLIVNSFTPSRTSTVVNVTISTANEASRLNDFGTLLLDDQGGRYLLVAPADNSTLNVPRNSTLEGDLVFSGRINPAARSLTLVINERGGSADSRLTNPPQFRMVLPLPQRSGALDPDRLPDDLPGPGRLAVAAIAPGLAAAEALGETRLSSPAEAPGAPATGGLRPGGAVAGGLAASRVTVVQQLRRDLQTQQTDRGEVVALSGDILFDFDRWTIRRDAEPKLHQVARLIAATEPRRVLVEGHTDSRGAEAYNLRLSERRAGSVADWLAANGTARDRLSPRGFGEARPVAPNERRGGVDDPDGRQRNRRVEVVLQGGQG